RVLLTETLHSMVRYPSEAAALEGDHPGLTSQELLFTRIALDLSEQLMSLIRRAAGQPDAGTEFVAAPDVAPSAPAGPLTADRAKPSAAPALLEPAPAGEPPIDPPQSE